LIPNGEQVVSMFFWRYSIFIVDSVLVSWLCSALRRYKIEVQQTRAINENTARSLEEVELKFKHIFESDMMGFLIGRLDGPVLNANEYFLNLIGYDREDLA